MKSKLVEFLLAVFFVLSGTAAVYARCVDVNHQHQLDAATEHETPSIHCPEVAINASNQVLAPRRFYGGELGNFLISSSDRADFTHDRTRYKHSKFVKRFSQQDLYRLEEVFRL